MMIQAVLFDCDGVIADSEPMWDHIDAAMLATYGVTYTGEHKKRVLGFSFQIALQFYKDTYNLRATIEELLLRRTEVATDWYANRIPLFADVPAVLPALKAMDLRIGLATSSVGALIHPFLDRHDITRYFDAIVTGEEVTRGKPDPDIYLRAAEKGGVAPRHCLVVEDALPGIASGKSAGMRVVAIPDPRLVDVTLYEGQADYTITRLGELPELLQKNLAPRRQEGN